MQSTERDHLPGAGLCGVRRDRRNFQAIVPPDCLNKRYSESTIGWRVQPPVILRTGFCFATPKLVFALHSRAHWRI